MRFGFASALAVSAVLVFGAPMAAIAEGPESVAQLASTLSPAVVNISTTTHYNGETGVPFPSAPDGSPLNEFFDEHNPGDTPEEMYEARSLGSGFIIAADGLIVTNRHVIDGADDIEVMLTDGTRLTAKVLGADEKMDLAVLRIEAGHDLPFVEFGDSDASLVGDWVMAIGNPFGLGGSVTLGIISARNRDIQSGPYDNFIQTDAAINQGNSGGPLFDMSGKVVGINTAIYARGGSSLGIGFAVPVNLAKQAIYQLAEFGETRRGWLGVGIDSVSDEIAASLGLPTTHGAMVVDVTKTGPADGVVAIGDIILEFDGKPIIEMRDLPRIVAATQVGKAVDVKVLRDGKELTLEITLGRLEVGEKIIAAAATPQLPEPATEADPELDAPPQTLSDMLGFDLGLIDEAAREKYLISEGETGLVITAVAPGTDAASKGLSEGQIVGQINQKPVNTVDDVSELVETARENGRSIVLVTIKDPTGGTRFIPVQLNK